MKLKQLNSSKEVKPKKKNASSKISKQKSHVAPSWKKVKLTGNLLSDDGGAGLEGLLGLEILEDFDGISIAREKPTNRKKERFSKMEEKYLDSDSEDDQKSSKDRKKKKKKLLKKKTQNESESNEPPSTAGRFVLLKPNFNPDDDDNDVVKTENPSEDAATENAPDDGGFDMDVLSKWNGLNVPEPILRVLAEKGFNEPTEIQALTLPAAIMGRRDILGAAETGSGKTLAFGIPILSGILHMKKTPQNRSFRKLSIKQKNIIKDEPDKPIDSNKHKSNNKNRKPNRSERDNWTPPPEEINNFPDFGRTIVENDADEQDDDDDDSKPLYALVLTPTRELAVQVKDHLVSAAKYTDIRIAAIFGGLATVKQERVLSKCPEIVVATPGRLWELISEGNKHLNKLDKINFLVVDETDRMIEKGHFEELKVILERLNADPVQKAQRQNFVFSATLTLIHELPQYLKVKNVNRKRKLQTQTTEQKLQTVIDYFGISQPKIVDITPSQLTGGTAHNLTECRITCSREQKDLYLYYFLQKHPGRTIVFCNSIECVRRLAKLFAILKCDPRPLHAKMAQKQRLKNLERFSKNPTGLLIATDVAARGLDIPNVEHVIHYQVPRTSENYIHRSGRTARGNKEGIAVLFMEPGEIREYVKLCRTIKRNEDLPLFPVADRYLNAVRERVSLACQVDLQELRMRRKNTDIGWLKKTAKEMDILVDDISDFSETDLYDSDDGGGAIERTKERRALKQNQDALKRLLAKPIFPKGFSYKYPSSIAPIKIEANGSADLNSKDYGNGITEEKKDNAVTVMKNAIEEYRIAKKQRNKKVKH